MSKIKGLEEKILILRLKDGDKTAFEIIFRHYYPGLLIFVSQIILDKDEAEEIVQDFFVQLWEKCSTLKKGISLKSYFFTSVKNRSFNYLKKSKIKQQTVEQLKYLAANNPLYNPDIFVESELQQRIKSAISKLPSRCSEIFVMNRFRGFSNDEIAEKLNISKRTVETQITNALKVLRVELKNYAGMLILLDITNF